MVAELKCSYSANTQSKPKIRYNHNTRGFPFIILIEWYLHASVFLFNFVDMSAFYCPQTLGSDRFHSKTLVEPTPSTGVGLVEEPIAVVGTPAGKLPKLVDPGELVDPCYLVFQACSPMISLRSRDSPQPIPYIRAGSSRSDLFSPLMPRIREDWPEAQVH